LPKEIVCFFILTFEKISSDFQAKRNNNTSDCTNKMKKWTLTFLFFLQNISSFQVPRIVFSLTSRLTRRTWKIGLVWYWGRTYPHMFLTSITLRIQIRNWRNARDHSQQTQVNMLRHHIRSVFWRRWGQRELFQCESANPLFLRYHSTLIRV